MLTKKFLFWQCFAFAIFFIAFAVQGFAQKSVLPKTMPQDFEVRYLEQGGLSPKFNSIRLDANTLYVEAKAFESPKRNESFAEISETDKESLYKVFVENDFDLIGYETSDVYFTDVIVQSISLRADGKVHRFQSDKNKPFSKINEQRFGNVLQAILSLENKYKNELKEFKLDYSILKMNSETIKIWFKNARSAEMNENELATAKFFAKEIVLNDNDDPKYRHKLSPLKDYKFQFVPFVDDKGTKHVWVNAFCREFNIDWRKDLVLVKDGGSCYFNFKINLDPKRSTTYDFQVNGEA